MVNDVKNLSSQLRLFPFLSNLSPHGSELLLNSAKIVELPPKHVLIKQHQKPTHAYFIVNGLVELLRECQSGESVLVTLVSNAGMIGQLFILDGKPSSATVKTVAPTTAIQVPITIVQTLINTEPSMTKGILYSMAKRLQDTTNQVESIAIESLRERVLHLLQVLAKHFPDRTITLSHAELASLAGGSRARVSEILEQFEKEHILQLHNRKITVNMPSSVSRKK